MEGTNGQTIKNKKGQKAEGTKGGRDKRSKEQKDERMESRRDNSAKTCFIAERFCWNTKTRLPLLEWMYSFLVHL